jgi:hypothetical protein
MAFFYLFDTDGPDRGTHLSGLCLVNVNQNSMDLSLLSHLGLNWAVMLLLAPVALTLPRPSGRTLVMTGNCG